MAASPSAGTLTIAGAGTLGVSSAATIVAGGTLDLGGTTQTQNGGVALTGGRITNGTLSSSGLFDVQAGTIDAGLAGSGGLTKSGTGTVMLSGRNTYTGATIVDGGALGVNGSIASSSGVTVNANAVLMGTGTVGGTTINSGGALLGGNGTAGSSLAISGSLAFHSGAYYLVQDNPATASAVNVTGSATLGGATVNAVFAPGSYVAKQYTILTAGSVSGTFVTPWIGGIGITPYAAGQFTTFNLPGYAESVVSGGGAFALSYAAKSVTDTRSELGLRTDKSFAMANGILTLRSRFAWAHDFNPDHSVAATFQTLPGATFVSGARPAADSALTTASAEMKWTNGWSAAAIFEGEFSSVTRSYAGKGVVRYAW